MLKKLIRIIPLILIVLLSLIVGTADISVGSIVTGDMDALFIFGSSRIPRTVSVFLAGSGLALSGMVMQTITQNRFAAPDTIGTVESAKLGMVVAMIVLPNMTQMWEMLFTFAFATIGTVFFLFLTSRFPMKKQLLIPLLGLMFGNIVGGFSNFFSVSLRFESKYCRMVTRELFSDYPRAIRTDLLCFNTRYWFILLR